MALPNGDGSPQQDNVPWDTAKTVQKQSAECDKEVKVSDLSQFEHPWDALEQVPSMKVPT